MAREMIAKVWRRFIDSLTTAIQSLKDLDWPHRLYLLGAIVAVIMLPIFMETKSSKGVVTWLSALSAVLFCAGFVWKIYILVMRIFGEHKMFYLGLIHAAILFAAHIYSPSLVSKVMGLPSTDFDRTTQIVTAWLYIPFWCYVLCLVSVCWGIVLVLFQVVHWIFLCFAPEQIIKSPFLIYFTGLQETWSQYSGARKSQHIRLMANIFGAFALGLLTAQVYEINEKLLSDKNSPIRWIAYKVDYQTYSKYPGLKTGGLVVFHENGFVSYATLDNDEVTITVEKYPTEQR